MPASNLVRRALRLVLPVAASLALTGCMSDRRQAPPVAIVTDLATVASCAFIAPVGAPPFTPGYRVSTGYDDFQDALRRRTAALGGTHLYITNPSAGWGGASAMGSAYRCIETTPRLGF